MKVFYQDTIIPNKAGLAFLEYTDTEEPKRHKDVITIPNTGYSLYQLTPSFDQFLTIKDIPEKHSRGSQSPHKCWFGGTDELPFLVRMNDMVYPHKWTDIWKGSPINFYEVIKPEQVRFAEKKNIKVQRQGDIFAIQYPIQDWEEANFAFHPSTLNDVDSIGKGKFRERVQLFGTRHYLTKGQMITCNTGILVKGEIEAPDHETLVIDKISLLYQTAYLFEPTTAD